MPSAAHVCLIVNGGGPAPTACATSTKKSWRLAIGTVSFAEAAKATERGAGPAGGVAVRVSVTSFGPAPGCAVVAVQSGSSPARGVRHERYAALLWGFGWRSYCDPGRLSKYASNSVAGCVRAKSHMWRTNAGSSTPLKPHSGIENGFPRPRAA